MTPEEFLKRKNIHSLDTKKRTQEVYNWMQEFSSLQNKELFDKVKKIQEKKEIINLIKNRLDKITRTAYNNGVIEAMIVSVNLFNVEPQIREKVLKKCLKKKKL